MWINSSDPRVSYCFLCRQKEFKKKRIKKEKSHGNVNIRYGPENELGSALEMVKVHAKQKKKNNNIKILCTFLTSVLMWLLK